MQNSAVHMVGLDRVGSIQARDARLRPFVLPQGAIEYRGDIPSRDLTLVASHLNLVIRARHASGPAKGVAGCVTGEA